MGSKRTMTEGAYALLHLIHERLQREIEATGRSDYDGMLTLIMAMVDRDDVLQDIPDAMDGETPRLMALTSLAVGATISALQHQAQCDAPSARALLAGGAVALSALMGQVSNEGASS